MEVSTCSTVLFIILSLQHDIHEIWAVSVMQIYFRKLDEIEFDVSFVYGYV